MISWKRPRSCLSGLFAYLLSEKPLEGYSLLEKFNRKQIEKTKYFFEPLYACEIKTKEAWDLEQNLVGFFKILLEIANQNHEAPILCEEVINRAKNES